MRVEHEREAVRLGALIAPRQLPRDARRLAVVHPRRHIQRVVVVGDAQLGGFRHRLPFLRIPLGERGDRRRPQPHLVVQEAIDDDGG